MAKEIEVNKNNNNKFYKAIEKLNYKKYDKFYLYDSDGKLFVNENQLLIITTEYYKKLFSSNDPSSLESTVDKSPWFGDAKPLNNLITSIEVSTAIHKLHNGKSPGKDGVYTDFIKYAGMDFFDHLKSQYNRIFENHKVIKNLIETVIIPINNTN